jgi:hypothetical protein
MDPNEEKVVKLYLTSIVTLIVFVVMFGTLAAISNDHPSPNQQVASPTAAIPLP